MRRASIATTAFLAIMTCAGPQTPHRPPQTAQPSGFWGIEIPNVDQIQIAPDGEHAWAVEYRTLTLWSATGQRKNVEGLPLLRDVASYVVGGDDRTWWLWVVREDTPNKLQWLSIDAKTFRLLDAREYLLPGRSIVNEFGTGRLAVDASGRHAWLEMPDYLLSFDSNVGKALAQFPWGSMHVNGLRAAGSRAWVSSDPGKLAVFDEKLSVLRDFGSVGPISEITPVGNGSRAWIELGPDDKDVLIADAATGGVESVERVVSGEIDQFAIASSDNTFVAVTRSGELDVFVGTLHSFPLRRVPTRRDLSRICLSPLRMWALSGDRAWIESTRLDGPAEYSQLHLPPQLRGANVIRCADEQCSKAVVIRRSENMAAIGLVSNASSTRASALTIDISDIALRTRDDPKWTYAYAVTMQPEGRSDAEVVPAPDVIDGWRFARGRSVVWIEPPVDPASIVAYVAGGGHFISTAEVNLGNTKLAYSASVRDAADTQARVTEASAVTVHFKLLPAYSFTHPGDRFYVSIVDTRGRYKSTSTTATGSTSSAVLLDRPPPSDTPLMVTLHIMTESGTEYRLQWQDVRFGNSASVTDTRSFRTIFAFVLISCVVAIASSLTGIPSGIRSWLGATLLGTGLAVAPVLDSLWNVEPNALRILIALGAIGAVAAGLLSPAAFRLLAQQQPFRMVAPAAVLWPRVRSKLFRSYAEAIGRRLSAARRTQAQHETYVSLPATIASHGTVSIISKTPAADIAAAIRDDHQRHILIEAPGGHGKSALLRQVADESRHAFRTDARMPLPVFCDVTSAGSVRELITTALGRFGFSEEVLRSQLQSRAFYVVLDGLSESAMSPKQLQEFLDSDVGEHVSVVAAMRPSPSWRSLFAATDHIVITPLRLSEKTLSIFVDAYLEHDRTAGVKSWALTPSAQNVCRGRDGTYLPALTRWTMLAGSDDVYSVADIYRKTLELLLPDPTDHSILDEAATLCVQYYWKTGRRGIFLAHGGAPHADLIRRLIGAGILIDSESAQISGSMPLEVRFFHDSMETYLTARALSSGPDPWKSLFEAAGSPRFRSREESSDGLGPEIFEMLLAVMAPQTVMLEHLERSLSDWASEFGAVFTLRQITELLGTHGIVPSPRADVAPGQFLSTALTGSWIPTSSRFDILVDLYIGLAPSVWAELERRHRLAGSQ